jgi:hypothetical protein
VKASPAVQPLPPIDIPMLAATAALAYALANVLHEGVGHGGLCLATGGYAEVLSTVHFECGGELSRWSSRAVSAGGTLVNLVAGAAFFLAMRRVHTGPLRHFLWLSMTVNLLVGFGYLMVPTAIGFGDWIAFLDGLDAAVPLRISMVVVGTAGWLGSVALSRRELEAFLHRGPMQERRRRARRLSLLPYLFGCSLKLIAGAFNPVGVKLLLISALAASMGATAALPSFIPDLVKDPKPFTPELPLGVPRSRAWLITAAIASAIFIAIIGRGIQFTH